MRPSAATVDLLSAAAFYVNKLILAGILGERINPFGRCSRSASTRCPGTSNKII
jgi:hypothetical protein